MFALTNQKIMENQQNILEYCSKQGWDALYLSSFDPYLSEYVPRMSNHRYYVTGFTGSVAEVLIRPKQKIRLYVDGRYFEQADQEVDAQYVEVVKCTKGITEEMLSDIEKFDVKTLAFEQERTPLSHLLKFKKIVNPIGLIPNTLRDVLAYEDFFASRPIIGINNDPEIDETLEKLKRIFATDMNSAFFVTALDSLSWLVNARGYHLPHLSSFMGKALVSRHKIWVFIEPEVEVQGDFSPEVEFIKCSSSEFANSLKKIKWNFDRVFYDARALNSYDYEILSSLLNEKQLKDSQGLIPFHSVKTPNELKMMKDNFIKSNKVIFKIISWVHERYLDGGQVSEQQLNEQTSFFYQEEGSVEQSFATISGIAANSSIIHYGSPSPKIFAKTDDVILLDSGGYFKGGFATDTTRTFRAHPQGKPDLRWKEIYTLVLKGVIQAESAIFPIGTEGKVIDGLARAPMMKYGYNFAHGTGHGVGIHVHEDGTRISPTSNYPLKAGHVVSIEPGIYIPGFGGVRLENIVVVKEHPEFAGFLCFEPLVYIDYDLQLIDQQMLTHEELAYLQNYRKKCLEFGNLLYESKWF